MMISEAPLPMPKVVIWSATHITKSDAVVMPITVIRWKPNPGFATAWRSCPSLPVRPMPRPGCDSTVAMPHDCTTQRTIVR